MRKLKFIGFMGTLMGLLLMGSLLAGSAFAAPNKVDICHFPDGSDVGHIISVSGNGSAVDAHRSLHGDVLTFEDLGDGMCADSD